MNPVRRVADYVSRHGMRYTLRRSWEKVSERWLGAYDRVWAVLAPTEEELAFQREHQPDAGLISVVIPVYNPQARFVRELCDSLRAQSYANWEACFWNTGSSPEVREALGEAAASDSRIRVWHSARNEGISGNTNRAIAQAKGAWIALCDHDDLLTPDALWRVADCAEREHPDLIYTDEDKITGDGRHATDPHMKPDYCPDNLLSSNYICHLMAIRRELLEEAGGENSAFDGSQDHELALRCADRARRIAHVRAVCYHWRTVGASMSHQHLDQCLQASCRAAREQMAREGYAGSAEPCHGVARLRYPAPEGCSLRVILTGSGEKPCLPWPGPIAWTAVENPLDFAAVNRAAAEAREDFILLLHKSVHGFSPDFTTELASLAQRSYTGAVSPTLLDERGRIAHMGFAVGGPAVALPRQLGLKPGAGGWHELARQTHNVGAVSLACCMIRREKWLPIPETYQSAMAAAAWCASLSAQGLWHTVTPNATAVCEESSLLLTGTAPSQADAARFRRDHPDYRDSCWHPYFREDKGDFCLKDVRALAALREEERRLRGMKS